MYYALTLNAQGTSAPAFFSVTPTSNLQISQGGVTLAPSSPTSAGSMVNIYPQTLQISAPAGLVAAGVTIITNESKISGRAVVSPAITVATVISLYGSGSQPIGQAIIDPGDTSINFSFDVPSGSGLADAGTAEKLIGEKIGAKEPPAGY